MALRNTVGMRLSELKDNHMPSRYTPREYLAWHDFECYGFLPDGSYFGVGQTRDIDECWKDDFLLVGSDGTLLEYASASNNGGWPSIGVDFPMPDAIVASPSGKSIVWLASGELWAWQYNADRDKFAGFEVHRVHVPGDAVVVDARMRASGRLDVWCADGERYTYACDADALLAQGTWGSLLCTYPRSFGYHTDKYGFTCDAYIRDCTATVSNITGLLVHAYTEAFNAQQLPNCFRELRFASDYECVESWVYCGASFERVVLPAGVSEVEELAFAWNRTLTDLVIEGDLSRLANWEVDAFEDCPCEAGYLELRDKARVD